MFNDTTVTPWPFNAIQESCFGSKDGISNQGTSAYLLVYERHHKKNLNLVITEQMNDKFETEYKKHQNQNVTIYETKLKQTKKGNEAVDEEDEDEDDLKL